MQFEVLDEHRTCTPFGVLNQVDLTDFETQTRILSFDKHQILEGGVFEQYIEREVFGSEKFRDRFKHVKAETAIATSSNGRKVAFVLFRERTPGLGRYLSALRKMMPVWCVWYHSDSKEFLAREISTNFNNSIQGGMFKCGTPTKPLMKVVQEITGQNKNDFEVKDGVRDAGRQKAVIWGNIFPSHDKERIADVVINRIFLNFCLTPYFMSVRNIDYAIVDLEQVWLLEIKHKFPFKKYGKLTFGLNNGHVVDIKEATEAGIRCAYIIFVKPVWRKNFSTQVLFNENRFRNNTIVLAREITNSDAKDALRRKGGKSGAHTTITGDGGIGWKPFNAEDFFEVGYLSDNEEILAGNLVSFLDDCRSVSCTDELLLRLSKATTSKTTN